MPSLIKQECNHNVNENLINFDESIQNDEDEHNINNISMNNLIQSEHNLLNKDTVDTKACIGSNSSSGNSSGSSINLNNQMVCSSSTSDNCILEAGGGGSSRSSSSIGAANNEEVLIHNAAVANSNNNNNINETSDLSSSSRRSSLSAELDQIMVSTMNTKSRSSSGGSSDLLDDNLNNKTLISGSKHLSNKHRTNSYFNRGRRSRRIIQTPPPSDEPTTGSETNTELLYDDQEENEKHQSEGDEYDLLTLKSDVSKSIGNDSQDDFVAGSLDLDLYDYLSRKNLMKLNNKNDIQPKENSCESISFEKKLRKWNLLSNNNSNSELEMNANNASIANNSVATKSKEKISIPPVFKYLNKNIINSIFQNETKTSTFKKRNDSDYHYISDILNDLITSVVSLVENNNNNFHNEKHENESDMNCNLIMSNVNLINLVEEKGLIKTLLSDISNLKKNDAYYSMLNSNTNAKMNVDIEDGMNKEFQKAIESTNESLDSSLMLLNKVKTTRDNQKLDDSKLMLREDEIILRDNVNAANEFNIFAYNANKTSCIQKDAEDNFNNNNNNLEMNISCSNENTKESLVNRNYAKTNENSNLNTFSNEKLMEKPLVLTSSSSFIQSHDSNLDNVRISKEILDELVCLVVENNSEKINPFKYYTSSNSNRNNSSNKVNMSDEKNEKQTENDDEKKQFNLPTSKNNNMSLNSNSINLKENINNNENVNLEIEKIVEKVEKNETEEEETSEKVFLSETQIKNIELPNLTPLVELLTSSEIVNSNDENLCNTINTNEKVVVEVDCINYDNREKHFNQMDNEKNLEMQKEENISIIVKSNNEEDKKEENIQLSDTLNEKNKVLNINNVDLILPNEEKLNENKMFTNNDNNITVVCGNDLPKQSTEIKESLITCISDVDNKNIKKIVFKNKDVVLIEECLDEEDDEEAILIKNKKDGLTNLFATSNETVSAKPAVPIKKSSTSHNIRFNNISKPNDIQTANNVNNEDDPYVKAALERFDAFCKSKSTHSLDQTNVTNRTPASIVQQRQKSPFLTRKTITQPNDEPNLKENIGSFIKRRQARIEPNLNKQKNSASETDDEQKMIKLNNPRSLSESRKQMPTNLFSKSSSDVSNSKNENENLFSNTSRFNRNNGENQSTKSTTPLGSSSLAKKFLGSLTPQLEPFIAPEPSEPETERDITTLPTTPTPPSRPTSSLSTQSAPKEKESTFKRRPVTFHKSNSKTYGKFGSVANKDTESAEKKSTSSSNSSDNSANSSPTHTTSKSKVNIIKLEVVNSKKQAATKAVDNNNHDKNSHSPTEKSNSKPPLPPATPTGNISSINSTINSSGPSSWRSKLRSIYSETPIIDGSDKTSPTNGVKPVKTNTSNTNETITKPPTPTPNKPISRIIPLEVKNSKTGTKTTINTTNNKSTPNTEEKQTPINQTQNTASPKNESPFVITPVTDRFRSLSALRQQEKAETTAPTTDFIANIATSSSSSTGGVFQRTRSVGSSFTPPVLLTRTASNIDYQKQPICEPHDSYSLENSFESKNSTPDPIAEKACNNFMFKLMEFQRQHKPYVPVSTPPTTINPGITSPFNSNITPPSTLATSAYTGPIVSARTSNANIQLNENNTLIENPVTPKPSIATSSTSSTATTPLVSSTPSPYAYKPPAYSTYTPIYHSYIAPSYTETKYTPPNSIYSTNSSNMYDTQFPDPIQTSSSTSTSQRPYVSAIRKRRTLFSDGFDPSSGSENEGFYSDNGVYSFNSYEHSNVPRSSTVPGSIYGAANSSNSAGYPTARNRPLSIVSEEANNLRYNLNSNTVNSNTITSTTNAITDPISTSNTTKSTSPEVESKQLNDKPSYRSLPRPLIKKSNSINSNKYESTPLNSLTNSISNSNMSNNNNNNNSATSSTLATSTTKIRSTPFNRSTAINNNESNSTVQTPKRINSETNNKSCNIIQNSNIKCQNEIAIVTSMMPKTRDTREGSHTTNSTNSSSISRIRSLDSKNREKFKTTVIGGNNSTLKKPTNLSNLPPQAPAQQNSTNVPSCYLYGNGSSSPTSKAKQQNEIGSITDLSAASALNTTLNARRKSQTLTVTSHAFGSTFTNSANSPPKTPPESTTSKTDVFERLSSHSLTNKRTNSMKNLNNSSNNSASNSNAYLASKSFRNNNVSLSSDPDADKKSSLSSASSTSSSSSHSGASSNDEATTNDENAFLKSNSSNMHQKNKNNANNSKTSVFERLYKSNIAAHMSQNGPVLNEKENSVSLKKNMSVSSASLASSGGLNTSTISNPGPNKKQIQNRQKLGLAAASKSTKSLNLAKSFNKLNELNQMGSSDESHENNSNEQEMANDSSSESASETHETKLSSDVNFIVPVSISSTQVSHNENNETIPKPTAQSSFLSHKLMDLYNK